MLITIFVLFLAGLILGSFATALTFRIPRNLNWVSGRSKCVKCKNIIRWFDNIPVLSYLFLKGKCRVCKEKISIRYPLIELSVAISFVASYIVFISSSNSIIVLLRNELGILGFVFLLLLFFISILITIIDLENKIIPDEMVFLLLALIILTYLFIDYKILFINIFVGFACSLFLLLIHIFTKGRGMGLGDVKYAIPIGLFLGYPYALIWMLSAFVIGAMVAVFMLISGKAKRKDEIAFGPFLAISFMIVSLWGDTLLRLFIPL